MQLTKAESVFHGSEEYTYDVFDFETAKANIQSQN